MARLRLTSPAAAALAATVLALLPACRHAPPSAGPPVQATQAAAPLAPLPERPWSDEILYFVLVDRFANGDPANDVAVDPRDKGKFHGGDLKGLTAQLDEIASLGVTAIWVNPLVQNVPGFVTGAGFPDWAYHGYWADDFTRLDPRFGTDADLEAFVRAAHARGLRVLLDVVYNHAGYDSRLLRDPGTAGFFREACGQDDLTSCIAGLPDLATERPEVRDWLLAPSLERARRFGLDGFRLDTVKHVDHPFWQEHRKRLRAEVSPDFFLLGEVWGGDAQVLDPWFAPDELDAGFDFGFQGSALGWVQGRGRTVAFARYLESRGKVRPGHLLAHYLSSHDVEGGLSQLGGDVARFKLAAALQMTTSGLPVVFYGEEVGRDIGKWPMNRSDMPWGDRGVRPGAGVSRDEALRGWYQRLLSARRAHPALGHGAHRAITPRGDTSSGDLLVFLREDAASGDAVLVAVNRGEGPAEVTVERPAAWKAELPRDALGGGCTATAGEAGTLKLQVPGKTAAIFVRSAG